MTNPGVDRLALLQRQLQPGEPSAPFDAEQVRARRLALETSLQYGMDLVLGPRARTHQLLAAGEPTTQDPAALIGHPHRLKLTLPQQLGKRSGVELVGLGPRARDPGVIRGDHHHTVHIRLEDASYLPAAPGHLQRHPARRTDSHPAPLSPPACPAPAPPNGPSRPRRSPPRRSHDAHPGRSHDRPI